MAHRAGSDPHGEVAGLRPRPVVHIARLGSDLVIPPLLALSATVPAMLLVQLPPAVATVAVAAAAILIVAVALGFGLASYRRTVDRIAKREPIRVAAVAAAPLEFDGAFRAGPGDPSSPAYRDIDGLVGRYQPAVTQAIARGARLLVLPEVAAIVTATTRQRWLAAVSKCFLGVVACPC